MNVKRRICLVNGIGEKSGHCMKRKKAFLDRSKYKDILQRD